MKRKTLLPLLLIIVSMSGCSVYQTFQNISRLKFKLDTVNAFQVSGISVSGKSKLQDFSAMDVLKLTSDVAGRHLPVSFVINVNALNPNNGTGGYPRTDVSLKSFPFRLLIDEKETVTGNIDSAVTVPGKGEAVTFPIRIQMDLYSYFADRGYDGLLNLVLKLGGQNKDPLKIKLVAKPTVSSMLGDIPYPGELTIVQTEYK